MPTMVDTIKVARQAEKEFLKLPNELRFHALLYLCEALDSEDLIEKLHEALAGRIEAGRW